MSDEKPEYIFEVSWEVCNKVGGIHTVLSTRARTMCRIFGEKVVFVGPDIKENNPEFQEDLTLLPKWRDSFRKNHVEGRIGRWNVPGSPIVILVDFKKYYAEKDEIYAWGWNAYKVDSLHAYGDYDEASMFSISAAKMVESLYNSCLKNAKGVVYQAHEWMCGLGMLYIRSHVPGIATIFTTHATSIGRSIVSNGKDLYKYLAGYNGDQMAGELNMQSKHSVEKQSAFYADCFSTVSEFTNLECQALLGKAADAVLPNGFETSFVPKGMVFKNKRKRARKIILKVAETLTGTRLSEDTLIVSTSGRNDYRCKGFDVFIDAVSRLRTLPLKRQVLALIEVPCWVKAPRADLRQSLDIEDLQTQGLLPSPYVTHELYNEDVDRIMGTLRGYGLTNQDGSKVKVMLIPCYLDGQDGIFNLSYYDMLTANDVCVYPSYYEPWGYTPLEGAAFGIPTITTTLAGFGLWVEDQAKAGEDIRGLRVIGRNDDNFKEVSEEIAAVLSSCSQKDETDLAQLGKSAALLARKAEWRHFISYYRTAYDVAENNRKKRNGEMSWN